MGFGLWVDGLWAVGCGLWADGRYIHTYIHTYIHNADGVWSVELWRGMCGCFWMDLLEQGGRGG